MSREWQQTKLPEYVMPYAVYYQSIWAVRDYDRMITAIRDIEHKVDSKSGGSIVKEPEGHYRGVSSVENKALELAIMKERIEGIRKALLNVPVEYRSYIISNIVAKNPGSAFPNKIWRMWKQRFLYDVAKNLSMI